MMANFTPGMANTTSKIDEQNENLKQEIASSNENTKHEINNLAGKIDATRSELTEHTSGVLASFEAKFGTMQQELATVNKNVMLTREEVERTTAALREIETRVKTLEIRPESHVNPGYVNDLVEGHIKSFNHHLENKLCQSERKHHEEVEKLTTHVSQVEKRIENLSQIADSLPNFSWSGNLRAKLHSEWFYLGKGKTLAEHLSEVYDKSRHLTPPVSDEEFATMIFTPITI
ncbi:hypothetical protein PR048_004812 [Dryococelus australis]|uniref:Uncharacterized protein n=1 Tax=Dryococelus australis TaxID=614101 RepID=A0ABQ9I6G3_9NEOP|nr:hypothetical protein PR048_004812 [Dryococelus australis]